MATKDKLRKKFINARLGLDPKDVARASKDIAERVRALEEWNSAEEVLAYWPVQNEVDTRNLLQELWDRGTTVLLPRCRPGQPGIMDLARVTCESDLTPGSFSIMEPGSACTVVNLKSDEFSPDLALVPGVAFDRNCFRIGFGGGYYDRLLEGPRLAPTLKIGLCYDFQLIRKLPVEDWDRPVNMVCTEAEECRR